MSAVWLLALPRHSDTLSGTHTGALEVRLVATATIASNIQRPTSNVVQHLTASKSGFSQIWSVSNKGQGPVHSYYYRDPRSYCFFLSLTSLDVECQASTVVQVGQAVHDGGFQDHLSSLDYRDLTGPILRLGPRTTKRIQNGDHSKRPGIL